MPALAAREQADLGVETRVQTKVQALEQLNVLIFLGLGDAPRKAATLAATLGEGGFSAICMSAAVPRMGS